MIPGGFPQGPTRLDVHDGKEMTESLRSNMNVTAHLDNLTIMHPQLSWNDMRAAAVAIFADSGAMPPFEFELEVKDVPGFDDDTLWMKIDARTISDAYVAQLRRTYEPARLVELAAIAIAGLALYHAGGHVIDDVALRGTGADYLVDEGSYLLEVAGRSRRRDFQSAWRQKWQRLLAKVGGGFFVCVAEFESRSGRLAFND
jgi:hypothetical protein